MSRVLDMTRLSGAYATRLLAEQGHEVIRIEPPDGDAMRRLGPYLGGEPDVDDGAYHQFHNAGKRSLALDLTTTEGREAFARLARTAEVIVASTPLPMDEDAIRAINPNVVLAVFTGDERPEICAYTRAGLLALTGHPGQMPVMMGGHIIYAATGSWAMIGIAAAMLVQKMTGQGETVTIDIQECVEEFLDHAVENYTARGRPTERRGHRGAVTPISGAFPSSDGYWMLSLHDSVDRWLSLMDWMKDPELANDKTLLDYDARLARKDMILDRIGNWAKAFPKIEVVTEAQRRRIPSAPVCTALELADDAQLIDRGFLVEVEHPKHGKMWFPRGAMATLWNHEISLAPELGADNSAILGELGYSPAEQMALFERGAT